MLVIVLAATGTALLTGGPIASLACFALLALGNFLLHQVLQQFIASLMGCVIATAILALAIWTARDRRTPAEFLAGAAAIGFAAGAIAVTSPEALPFYLLFLGIIFIRLILAHRQIRLLAAALFAFSAAAVIVSAPLMFAGRPALWRFHVGRILEGRGPASRRLDRRSGLSHRSRRPHDTHERQFRDVLGLDALHLDNLRRCPRLRRQCPGLPTCSAVRRGKLRA